MSDLEHIFDDYPDVDKRSCRLLGPTALVCLPAQLAASTTQCRTRRSHKHSWACWSLARWCSNGIGSRRSDHGEYGASPAGSGQTGCSCCTLRRLFDVSKQIIGQMFVHGVNVLISDVVAHVSSGNACVLYFLNILLDTTLGSCYACANSYLADTE